MDDSQLLLIERFLDGDLAEDEAGRLRALVDADAEVRGELAAAMRMRGLAAASAHPDAAGEGLARVVMAAVERGAPGKFEARVLARIDKIPARRRGVPGRRPSAGVAKSFWWLAAAACLAVAIGVAAALLSGTKNLPAPPAIAEIAEVSGDVRLVRASGELAADAKIYSGDALTAAGASSRANIRLTDGTRIDLGPDTRLKLAEGENGKSVHLDSGAVSAEVAPQPPGKPLVFITPHAQATVVGTRLTLAVTGESTRLDVHQGTVRIRKTADEPAVLVGAGFYAVAAPGAELVAKPLAAAKPALGCWVIGYYLAGEAGAETIDLIPWSKYTHVIHNSIQPMADGSLHRPDYMTDAAIRSFVAAAHGNGVKALICAHEFGPYGAQFKTCTDPARIDAFVRNIVDFVTAWNYDGVNIDWRQDLVGAQYQDLISKLRAALPAGKTITVETWLPDRHFIKTVQDKIDQIILRTYEMDWAVLPGNNPAFTWHTAATCQGGNKDLMSMDIFAWHYNAGAGIPANKICITIPFNGLAKKGLKAGAGGAQGVTDPLQPWAFGDVKDINTNPREGIWYSELIRSVYWKDGVKVWDDGAKAQYIRYDAADPNRDAFVTYVGVEQILEIVKLVRSKGYGGIATHGLPHEFIKGQAGDARYPLSTALWHALEETAGAAPAGVGAETGGPDLF
jgi:hypothetical protein